MPSINFPIINQKECDWFLLATIVSLKHTCLWLSQQNIWVTFKGNSTLIISVMRTDFQMLVEAIRFHGEIG